VREPDAFRIIIGEFEFQYPVDLCRVPVEIFVSYWLGGLARRAPFGGMPPGNLSSGMLAGGFVHSNII
jgi:hypothetical protein